MDARFDRIAKTNAGVICACAPSVATLFRQHHPHASASRSPFAKAEAMFSKRSASSEGDFNRVTTFHLQDIRLETKILSSAAWAESGFWNLKTCLTRGGQVPKAEVANLSLSLTLSDVERRD